MMFGARYFANTMDQLRRTARLLWGVEALKMNACLKTDSLVN